MSDINYEELHLFSELYNDCLNTVYPEYYKDKEFTVNQVLINNNNSTITGYIDSFTWKDIRDKVHYFYTLITGKEPDKNDNNRDIYKGKDVAYIIATIKLVKSGI